MKLYRCDLCGRVFHERMPHVCTHGNYRKRNLFFTEFEDVDNEYIKKSDLDVKEKSFPEVNWEQRRYDIAKDVHRQMLDWIIDKNGEIMVEAIEQNRPARNAVFFADALIAELKKEK